MKEHIENDKEFQNIIKELILNETVQKMHIYRQHCDTSCFEHCLDVSYYCYKTCKKLNLDYISAARAGMLHDLFLYDWRTKNNRKGFHAFTHGKVACDNACKLFNLNDKEKDIITNHMWPVTLRPPKYLESYIITFVDKYCAILESIEYLRSKLVKTKLIRYAYIFLGILLLR